MRLSIMNTAIQRVERKVREERGGEEIGLTDLPEEYLRFEFPQDWKYLRELKERKFLTQYRIL
jgi:hypothetical protein